MTTSLVTRRAEFLNLALMALAFVGMTLLLMPLSLFVYDNDEGINVIKAVLMGHGYPLYTQTWSDQPPVFTQILATTFTLFGQSMLAARLTVFVLATLLVWAYTSVVRLHLGVTAAWVALLLLMLSDNFVRLSVAVMIGLPALSFAMVALYLLQRFKLAGERNVARLWLVVAGGVLMGVAMQTKLFVVFLVPLLALDLLDFGRDWFSARNRFWRKLGHGVLFGLVVLVTWGAIALYYNAVDREMLLGAHLNASVQSAYEGDGGWAELSRYLLFDYGHLLLALAGVVVIFVRRQWHGLLPLSWLLLATLLLSNHSPIWYHHYQFVAIPLSWLGAYLVPLLRSPTDAGLQPNAHQERANGGPISSWFQQLALLVLFVVVLSLIYSRAKATIPYYNQRIYDADVVALLQQDAADTTWVFADQAIYPFYAGLQVPPEVAVFSRKRFFGESLDNHMLVDVLERYRPEQVLLTRFKDDLLRDPEFVTYLNDHYTVVEENINFGYYRLAGK